MCPRKYLWSSRQDSLGKESKAVVKLVESGGYMSKSCAMIFELLSCGYIAGVGCVRSKVL